MPTNNEPLDIEAEVTRLAVPGSEELDRAKALCEQVLAGRLAWLRAWHEFLFDPAAVQLRDFPPDTVGCSPGSCELVLGERVLARFIVRFDEAECEAMVEAQMPRD